MELKGTTAVITGSTGRMIINIVKALAQAGCNCICHYHTNKQKAQMLIEEIRKMPVNALSVQADLTKPHQIDFLFEKATELGTPQILINSAALFERTPLEEITFEDARKFFDLNLTASILTTKAFAKVIKDKFGDSDKVIAKIINVCDVAGVRPWAEYSLYCASKAGLIGATKAFAKELATAVCVNAIAPGIADVQQDFDEKQKQRQLSFIPLKRFAKPNEITAAVIFLLENDYITGQTLTVAGGRAI